jgi:hypothetical protein
MYHRPLSITGFSAISLGFAVVVQAYIIDDSNGTIQYSPAQAWTHNVNSTAVNNDEIFNATL